LAFIGIEQSFRRQITSFHVIFIVDFERERGGEIMKKMRSLILGFLVGLCLGVVLFAAVRVVGQGGWNPWADINDDGWVNAKDAVLLGTAFGSNGEPLFKASLEYDSGWINVSDKAGQYFDVVHNLNSADVIVDITGKMTADGAVHQRNIGGTDFVAGWNKTYGGVSNDAGGSVVQTSDGGYAIGGYTDSFGAGGVDCYLVKTDSSGNMQWNKTYGGAANDGAYFMVQTSDGGYALAGWTQSFGAGSDDLYLIKTDASGNALWNKTYGGIYDDGASGCTVQTGDGGYTFVGLTGSFGAGSMDWWLVRTDANGYMQWSKTYGGPDYDSPSFLIQTRDGGYAMAGSTNSYGTSQDMWLIKTDAAGNALDGFKYGLAWVDSTANSITLYRGTDDAYWNYVRVRVWKVKESP
jgi:hypothetical protein